MIMANRNDSKIGQNLQNGAAAAAILAAGIGCAAFGIFKFLGDAFKGIANFFNFYGPAGPLSGVTISAVAVWLAAWFMLASLWDGHDVAVTRISLIAFILLALGFALTFPPFMYLIQGKH
jgi:hypothetical protein